MIFYDECLVFCFWSVSVVDRATSTSSVAGESEDDTRVNVGGQSGHENGP